VLKDYVVRINRAGWPYIAGFAAGSVVLGLIADPLGWIGLVLTLWCVYFFRDPDRTTPTRTGLIVSPADGKVSAIVEAKPPAELQMGEGLRWRVSIFMDIFSVHVNRVPCDGEVAGLAYRPGEFINALKDGPSERNERQSIRLRLTDGRELAVAQIAGFLARRIQCTLAKGQHVRAGERFGLIRFGSQLDVYLPEGVAPLILVGQTAIAGETVLADLASAEPRREGIIREGET